MAEILKSNGTNFICGAETGGVISFNSRTGAVVPTATDYTASMIAITPSGAISATSTQGAINELDAEKLALAGGTMTGIINTNSSIISTATIALQVGPWNTSPGNTGEVRFRELAAGGTNYVGFKAPDAISTDVIWTLPAAAGASGTILTTIGSNILNWSSPSSLNIGDVVGPAGSASGTLASFNGTTGKLIKDSGIVAANVVTNPSTATDTAVPRFSGTSGKIIQGSGVLINATNDVTGVGALTSTGNMTVGGSDFFVNTVQNQVGIGTASPDGSAILDLNTSSKGFLPPRMDTTARNGILIPANGLLIYNTTTNSFDGRINGSWQTVGGGNDVSNATPTTDNAIARFDGSTGKIIQGSGVLISDNNDISGVQNFTAKGTNTNNPVTTTAAINLMMGRGNAGLLNGGQTSADIALEFGGASGGYRHYISTTHTGTTNSTNNAINFYINNSAQTLSTAPGTGNVLALGITPIGVGVFNTTPTEALDVRGNARLGSDTSVGNLKFYDQDSSRYVALQSAAVVTNNVTWTLPVADGASGTMLATNGSGGLSWTAITGGTGGIGDVVGPGSATDNAIARFDTTGKLIQGSGILISDTNDISDIRNFTAKGTNSNTPSTSTAAINLMIGRTNVQGFASGQTSADLAFEYGGGGYKHYITSTHNGAASSNQNSLRFYLNDGVTASASSAPGTNNILGLAVTPVGVGVLTSTPTEALDVRGNIRATGQAYSTVYNNVASLAFNFNNGNVQYTTASCGASTLSNMVDGGSYQVAIQGATSGTCTFSHAGLTFRYAPANGVTTANTHSVYSMSRVGTVVYVSWITGFN